MYLASTQGGAICNLTCYWSLRLGASNPGGRAGAAVEGPRAAARQRQVGRARLALEEALRVQVGKWALSCGSSGLARSYSQVA